MINRILIPDILQPVSHYCHVVEANGVVWVSGLVGMNFDETIPESTKDQFDIAMRDLDTCLIAAGSSSNDVVKVRVFLTDIKLYDREKKTLDINGFWGGSTSSNFKLGIDIKNLKILFQLSY